MRLYTKYQKMHIYNPIVRHYLILFLLVIGFVFLFIFRPSEFQIVLYIFLAWVLVVWVVMFYSGRCQHCGASIPQVRFGMPKSIFPKKCPNCGNSYNERAVSHKDGPVR